MQEKLVVTVQELAPMLNTSTGVLYRMVREDKIPHRKIGRQTVFSIEGIKKWLEGDWDYERVGERDANTESSICA